MAATKWNIDPAHSAINFSVRHMVFARVRGRFGQWSGTLRMDGAEPTTGSVQVEIEASSVDTGTAERDNHLRSADFFDVEKYPKLSFKSTGLEKAGSGYTLHGDLTIRDVTRSVSLDLEYGGRGKDPWGNTRVGFTASGSVNREDFGLKWNQALEAGGVLVGDKVEIEIELQAVQVSD